MHACPGRSEQEEEEGKAGQVQMDVTLPHGMAGSQSPNPGKDRTGQRCRSKWMAAFKLRLSHVVVHVWLVHKAKLMAQLAPRLIIQQLLLCTQSTVSCSAKQNKKKPYCILLCIGSVSAISPAGRPAAFIIIRSKPGCLSNITTFNSFFFFFENTFNSFLS